MKVDVLIKGNDRTQKGGAQPCDGVSTNGKEDERHIKLQGFCSAFGSANAIAHYLKRRPLPILQELPCE